MRRERRWFTAGESPARELHRTFKGEEGVVFVGKTQENCRVYRTEKRYNPNTRTKYAWIDAVLRKWLARLPHPFTGSDRKAGYRYELSILQVGLSLIHVRDRPLSGHIFFEQVIRENLDIGAPDRCSSFSIHG